MLNSRYRITEKLGRGIRHNTYLGWDCQLAQNVVIRELRPNCFTGWQLLWNCNKENAIAQTVRNGVILN